MKTYKAVQNYRSFIEPCSDSPWTDIAKKQKIQNSCLIYSLWLFIGWVFIHPFITFTRMLPTLIINNFVITSTPQVSFKDLEEPGMNDCTRLSRGFKESIIQRCFRAWVARYALVMARCIYLLRPRRIQHALLWTREETNVHILKCLCH